MLQGTFLVTMLFIMIWNWVAELLYHHLDPRLARNGTQRTKRI
jgi:ABC-type dipeptide/oligopeptide/nickel transport system permease component